MLQIMHQRGRRRTRIAGQEHGRARHLVRRLLLETADQRSSGTSVGASCWQGCGCRAARSTSPAPSPPANSSGTQRALEHLEQIGGQEQLSIRTNGMISSAACHQLPLPQRPDHDEAEHAVDDHGRRDRDAIGRGERARRAEQQRPAAARRSAGSHSPAECRSGRTDPPTYARSPSAAGSRAGSPAARANRRR